jgi:alkanesulfonate monooxygenase SsuD/methylene tetrahydromethanopterin reductase-like flavin-dependent oxidoreductase (luciferase family)
VADDGSLDLLSLEYLIESGACVLGTPEQCIETCKRYEAAGVDQLLCLVNPYKMPHDVVMQTIRMLGEHVIPEFR